MPVHFPIRARSWAALAVGILLLGAWAVWRATPRAPQRVILVAPTLASQGRDLSPGLATLVSDLLEVLSGATVTQAQTLPTTGELKRLPPRTRLLRIRGQRQGDDLALVLEWNSVRGLLADGPWKVMTVAPTAPLKAFEQAVASGPLRVSHRRLQALVPEDPAQAWALLECLAIQDDVTATASLPATERLAHAAPDCASAWVALGDHLYRSLWVDPGKAGLGLNSRTHQAFQTAVALVPGHPRGTFLWSLTLTDTGNQRLALQQLQEAARLRPHCPDLYLGLAYAGRTSGLLEGARLALERRSSLLGPQDTTSAWLAETTYLYLGDKVAFEQELSRVAARRQDSSILFYQGYVALLNGQRTQALRFMGAGCDPALPPSPFRDLCSVYRAYLENRPAEGLALLHATDEVRGRLHIPDGEWTFKEAEAYSLLGDPIKGVDCATRAFAQGFSCATWYAASPFLEPARRQSRWPTLQRNVQERQAVLEAAFPPATFTP